MGTRSPYYVEFGWKELSKSNNNIDLPNLNTIWKAKSSVLKPESPLTLTWINDQDVIFNIHLSLDNDYMFSISQEVNK